MRRCKSLIGLVSKLLKILEGARDVDGEVETDVVGDVDGGA